MATVKNLKKKDALKIPPVKSYPSRKEWEAACWQSILGSKEHLDFIITRYERHMYVLRAAALDRIAQGMSYREIAEELWLSPQTISAIKKGDLEQNYRSYSETSKIQRKKRKYTMPSSMEYPRRRGRLVHRKYGMIRMPEGF